MHHYFEMSALFITMSDLFMNKLFVLLVLLAHILYWHVPKLAHY
jgi:hypothetical protein